MRRSLAGLLFGAAFVCACLALAGILLNRTVFSPGETFDAAPAVLGDTTLRDELVGVVATATAAQLGRSPADDEVVRQVLSTKAGARLVADLLQTAHRRLIGEIDTPVIMTTQQLVDVVRDERAAAASPVVLDVPKVTALSMTKGVVDWIVPLSLIGTVVFLVLCFLARPERSALVRTLGLGFLVLGALVAVFGYVAPKFIPTALTDSVWARIPPRLADDGAFTTVIVALLFAAAGLGLFAYSARLGRSRRWSTPINTYRYREERRWS